MRGYNWCHNKQVLSIFSAPNYCYRCGNEAAIIEIEDENNFNPKTYSSAPKSVYFRKKGKERRDSADIDGEEDEDLDKKDNKNEDEINEENEQKEINERINKVNDEYFHLKYELRYFV